MDSNPYELKAYISAYDKRRMAQDENNFYLMHYMTSAVTYAVEHCLAGVKAKTQLIKEPILANLAENRKISEMSEDERYNYELKQALENEEKWIIASRMKGLPETVV